MRAHCAWSYAPYKPPMIEVGDIYICRIVPFEKSIHIEWLGEDGAQYSVFYRKRNVDDFVCAGETTRCAFDILELEQETDYEFFVQAGEKHSRTRLARTGVCFFGSVVNYLHPEDDVYAFSGRYLCSPSFVRLPDGTLVASMDVFTEFYPQTLSLVFRSEDDGKTWHYACELFPCFWGKLFVYQQELYMLACSTEYGDLLIAKSTDGGRSFGEPRVLLRGGNGKNGQPGVHKNPQPVVEYNGRLWNTLEWGSWGQGYHAAMVASAPIGSDIMQPENWLFSEPVAYNSAWEGVPQGYSKGVLEGCLVVGPDQKLYNIMRYQMEMLTPNYGLALVFEVNTDHPEAPLRYVRAMNFPANHSKFEIKYDEVSGYYYSLASRITDSKNFNSRNLLSLMRSKDLYSWDVLSDVIDRRKQDPQKEGFQYVDFEIEGEDILFLCRTAINGAHNFHDANYSVFDKIIQFRNTKT